MPDKLRSEHHKAKLLHEVNRRHYEESSLGERVADKVITGLATWRFVAVTTVLNLVWIWLNRSGRGFDPPPFGNLTLTLSIAALIMTALVLIGQKRSSERDRLTLEHAAHESEEDRKETEELRKELRDLRQLTQDQTRLLQVIVSALVKPRGWI